MQRALKMVRHESGERQIDPYRHGPSEDVTLTAPGIGQLSDWKTWPPALAMVDQVIPFLVKTSGEFRALQRIINRSLRGMSLYVDVSDGCMDSTLVDRFVGQRILIPTDSSETYLVNLYGCLQYFFFCLWDRPLTIKRHDYNAKILEKIEQDFHALDLPVVTLEIPSPRVSFRPDKVCAAPWHCRRLPDLTTGQVFDFIYRFCDIVMESDDNLMNLFVMNRLLELSIVRRQIQPFLVTVNVIQYGQKGYSIGLPDCGSSEYVHRMIQQILDNSWLRAFNVRPHQTNPYAYYVQFDPVLKKHCMR